MTLDSIVIAYFIINSSQNRKSKIVNRKYQLLPLN
jgi:hypothetical protein